MQAAVNRLPGAQRRRRADNPGAKPHIATADDTGLLDALPIAAAIIEQNGERSLNVVAYNSRFLQTVEQSACEVQAERTRRAEMLRDSLTGLPNRLAFTEAIEKAGENVARDLEHAVLVVDMLRFSRINESMGSLAGDELLITFARRLILALRAG